MAQLPKRWYASKTVWFNALTIITVIATGFGWTPNERVAREASDALLAIAPLVNLILRFFTRRPVINP